MSIHQHARNVILRPTEPDEFGNKPGLEGLKTAWLHVRHCNTCMILLKHAKAPAEVGQMITLIAHSLEVAVERISLATKLGRFQMTKVLIVLSRIYHCRVDVRSYVDGMTVGELIGRWKVACHADEVYRAKLAYQEAERARSAE